MIYSYDDRMVSEIAPLGTRSYSYDGVGNRTGAIDRNGRQRTYKFDELDRLVEEAWVSDNRTFSYSYDAEGNMLTAGDSNTQHAYSYDQLNRLISDQVGGLTQRYAYDEVDNPSSPLV